MAITQAIESGRSIRAFALLGVFIVAKLAILAGRPVQISIWTPIAYFWQDILVALAFITLDIAFRRPWIGWTLYGATVSYIAINVPIARTLSSPLTWPMLGAAGAALSDSIRHHATPSNLALLSLTIASGIILPLLIHRLQAKKQIAIINPALLLALSLALLLTLLGPFASSRVDTIGMHRNAILALVTTALPRLSTRVEDVDTREDWRASPFETETKSDELSRLRGSAEGRNVVLIALESTGAESLRPYGAKLDPMPNLTELSSAALIFEDAYAVYPESIKALFTILCSRYPAMDTETESYARIRTPSLANLLKTAGYSAALFHSGRFMYLGMKAVVENRGFDVLEDAGAIGGDHESSFGVDEPSTVRRALAWVDSLPRGEKFFLTYLPIAGHHPYETPEPGPFPERSEPDRYLNALHYADASLGALLQGIRDRGLYRNTLFVIFGDHGQAFGRHQGNYGHTLFIYEENIRVPFLIAMPGHITQQSRITRKISLIDTAPTILDLLGLKAPTEHQGRSALEGKPGMTLFYTDYSLGLIGLRDGCWKYIYEMDSDRSKLFDLCRDATESNDLAHSNTERISAYRERLKRWVESQKALIQSQTR